MCGIMGYYSFGNTLPNKITITNMFALLETRGKDAAGFAFFKDNNLVIHKDAIKSSEMIKTDDWKNLELPRIMILHCRMKTQGTEKNNANNHPLFNKQGLCIVHNGIIYNDKEIFGTKDRDGEVDSEAILAVLSSKQKGDKIKRVFDRLRGSFAFAAINKIEPDKLLLVKKDNPLGLYYDSEEDILYFCSEREIMLDALNLKKISKRGFNLGEGNYHYYDLENNHALIVNSEGVESYKKYRPVVDRDWWMEREMSRNYKNRNEMIAVECPYCLSIANYDPVKLFNRCDYCGQVLSEEEIGYVL
jgi:glucosamine 6-phosphate synthetase-like amidotransferase/phosphosugar isomerase protein